MPKYDAVIIGSGIGGLVCGNILSKEGLNVCILEKQHQFGGNLQTFKRDGKVFDTGVHYVGGLGKGQNLYQYFKYLGIVDDLNVKRLDDAFDIINYEGKTYSFTQGFDHYIETLAKDFPSERNALREYKKQIQEICSHFPLYNLRPNLGKDNEEQFYERSIGDFLSSITSNKTLQNVLAGNNMLYAGIPGKTPVAIHALIINSLIEGAYRFIDGSHQIANLLIKSIEKNGGTLRKNSKVERLNVMDKKVHSATLDTGEVFEANHFISAIHPSLTLAMTDSNALRKSYRTRINSLDETISVFALYVSFKPQSINFFNHNYYHFNEDNVWTASGYNEKRWPQAYLLITPPTSNSDKYAETGTVLAYMKYEEVEKWKNRKDADLKEEYENFKREKAEKLISKVNQDFPGFKSSINKYFTSSPLTIESYTGSKHGSMYGIVHDSNFPLKTSILPRTKIPNLFLSGQNLNIHGILGVTVGAVFTCTELIGMEYLMNKIKNA